MIALIISLYWVKEEVSVSQLECEPLGAGPFTSGILCIFSQGLVDWGWGGRVEASGSRDEVDLTQNTMRNSHRGQIQPFLEIPHTLPERPAL